MKLEDVPAQVLINEVLKRFDEAVFVGRVRPKAAVAGVAQPLPKMLSLGSGDYGDQLGLVNIRRIELETLVGMQFMERMAPQQEEPDEAQAKG